MVYDRIFPATKHCPTKMLHNIIVWLLTTSKWLYKYHMTWIWSNITLEIENKLSLGIPNASVILTVNKYITQG